MPLVAKHTKCPNCLGMGVCSDGSDCDYCGGSGEVVQQEAREYDEVPCWERGVFKPA